MVLDLCFILYMKERMEGVKLRWAIPLLRPGTDPKYCAVQDDAIRDLSSYGSLSKSLQWRLGVSVLHSLPSAASQR